MSTKCCSRDGEGRKDKGGGEGSKGLKQLCVCVIKWYVKDSVWRRKIMYVCVTELCGKDIVCESDVCVCEAAAVRTFSLLQRSNVIC